MNLPTLTPETATLPAEANDLPACLRRDHLSPEWFPASTRTQLAMVMALCLVFAWTSFNRLNHTDLWGHLDFGRWIVQHRSLPALDPFAAEPSPKAVVPNAWLAQVVGYEVLEQVGLEGLVLGHALLATLCIGLLMAAIYVRGVPLSWAIAGGLTCYVLALPIMGTIRPQLFGMVGASLVLLACAWLPAKRHPLVWLPIVFCLWANLHGSFAMGLAMLGIAAIGNTWRIFGECGSLKQTASDLRCARLWSALALAIFGASINPQGPAMLVSVLTFGQHAALANITEWRSLSVASLSGVLFYSSLAIFLVLLKLSPRRWELSDLLMVLVFGLATIFSMRMLVWWAIVWPFVAAPYTWTAWQMRHGEGNATTAPSTMHTVLALGFIFMTLLLSPASNNLLLGKQRGIATIADKDTPIYVASEIERRHLQGNFFAPMDWSDYLIWEQKQGFRPLVYSHVHLLDPAIWRDQQQLSAGDADWLALADKHRLKYLVIGRDRNPQLAGQVVAYARQAKTRAHILYQDRQSLLVELRPAS